MNGKDKIQGKQQYQTAALEQLRFLETEYGFSLSESQSTHFGYFISYEKDALEINLFYEFSPATIRFYLNDISHTKVPFWKYMKQFDSSVTPDSLMKVNGSFNGALEKNINLLKKHGHEMLNGQEAILAPWLCMDFN